MMFARSIAPIPLAVAALFLAGLIAEPAGAATAAPKTAAAATPAAAAKQSVRHIVLKTGMAGGKMVYLDDKGGANPLLRVDVGDVVEISISSGEGAEHDIVFPELNVHSKHFNASTGPVKVRFQVTKPGKFTYFCSLPGHRQIGMEGLLEVSGPADASAAVSVPSQDAAPGDGARSGPVARKLAIAPPAANAVSVAMDPTAVPKPLGPRAPQLVRYSIETVELDGKLDDGTTFTYWTFGKKVPGPMLRVKKGDTVELT